ncbi:helix-turn-helix domain-containing protein [Knoellia sp. CPCC 206453]|uniref:helix-turn-helix domain-containing protein n=1 Tax=Knoellia pratensis TaxID=3404796 RepID=UPI00361070FF
MKRDTTVSTTAREILRRARRQQGLTQAELAERAGVSQTVVARYEARQQQPTVAALERLVAACGCDLEWIVRHASDPADAGGAVGKASHARFPGPIGRRLTARLEEVLTLLTSAGGADPRLYGGVADGTEAIDCRVLIGVTVPPGADRLPLMAASGHIGLLLGAPVRVLSHADVAAYGYDDEGTPLVSDTARAMGTPAR